MKTRSACCGSMPMPLSAQASSQPPSVGRAVIVHGRHLAIALNLIAFEIRFWNSEVSSDGSPRTVGRSPISTIGVLLARSARRGPGRAVLGRGPQVHGREPGRRAADSGEREQVEDQLLHPLRPVDREVEVLLPALVELVAVALLEELAEARDLAQRLLQVVRGDVGELLELGVRAVELAGLRAELGAARVSTAARSSTMRAAHRLEVVAELGELAGARRLDHVLRRRRR